MREDSAFRAALRSSRDRETQAALLSIGVRRWTATRTARAVVILKFVIVARPARNGPVPLFIVVVFLRAPSPPRRNPAAAAIDPGAAVVADLQPVARAARTGERSPASGASGHVRPGSHLDDGQDEPYHAADNRSNQCSGQHDLASTLKKEDQRTFKES
jgi:hypothetical protein